MKWIIYICIELNEAVNELLKIYFHQCVHKVCNTVKQ